MSGAAIIVGAVLIAGAILLTNHWQVAENPADPGSVVRLNRWTGAMELCQRDAAGKSYACAPQ
jgi:hypothetical protein